MKMVLFGAGKIGRSFIGQLFSRGGYEVVFVDIYQPVIDALNRRRSYKVIIRAEQEEVLMVGNVRGVLASDEEAVVKEIVTADLLAISVGQQGFSRAIPLIAQGLCLRWAQPTPPPLDLIIAENLRNAAEYFKKEITDILPHNYPFDRLVGLVETSIGKMVPIMTRKDQEADILQVFAEPYNSLILDKKGFKNPVPAVEGLAPKENIKAWVDRKLFIHNLGHATAAYLGYQYNPEFTWLWEVLEVDSLREKIKATMMQSARLLLMTYPDDFTGEDLERHIDDLLHRFANKCLGDTIYRVGCDLNRKLSANDRLAGAIQLALEWKKPYNLIWDAFVAGCSFRATDEAGQRLEGDVDFCRQFEEKGLPGVLKEIACLPLEIISDVNS